MPNSYASRDKEGMKQERKAKRLSKDGPDGSNLKTWSNYAKGGNTSGGKDGGGAVKPTSMSYPLSKKTGGAGSGRGRLAYSKKS